MRRRVIGVLGALALIAAPGAGAASRHPGLFGVVMTPDLAASPASILGPQMALMQRSGVQSLRTGIDWETTEPAPGVFDWRQDDLVVGEAAMHHLALVPIVEFTPRWASSHPSAAWEHYAPSSDRLYAAFMTALVARYGDGGSFWSQHPTRRYEPVRAWQIWNEPEGTGYDWRTAPWPSSYTALLKAAYRAVHHADAHALVITGALVGLACSGCLPWTEATALYRAGFKGFFDVLAVNSFTFAPSVLRSVNQSVRIVHLVRAVMAAHHDARRPIWVTEFTWPATASFAVPHKFFDGIETTTRGQAARLSAYYTRIATEHPENIQRAFWFDWASPYRPYPVMDGDVTFQYSGLLKWQPGTAFTPKAVLHAYARVALRFG
jgi:hypothetical protein